MVANTVWKASLCPESMLAGCLMSLWQNKDRCAPGASNNTAELDISMGDNVGNKGAGMSPFFEAI